jgi:transcriptional regulator with XRE-family HTH domain
MSFADKLKALRDHLGLTQKQLAEKAGLAQHSIANLEQGIRLPTVKTLFALAGALGTTVEELMKNGSPDETLKRPKRPRGRPSKPAEEPKPAKKKPRGRPE